MRGFYLIGVALVAGACASEPVNDASRAEMCRDLFQNYDRDLEVRGPSSGLMGTVGVRTALPSVNLAGLRQYNCVTFASELPDFSKLDLQAYRAPPAGNGPTRYVHLATAATDAVSITLSDVVKNLGYPVQTKGEPALGRRVFIGPLRSPAEEGAALRLAEAMGIYDAYLLSRIP